MDKKTSNQANPNEVERQFFSSLIQSDHVVLDRILTDDFILIDVLRGAEIDKTTLPGGNSVRTAEVRDRRTVRSCFASIGPPRLLPVVRSLRPFWSVPFTAHIGTPMFIFSKQRNAWLKPKAPRLNQRVIWQKRVGRYVRPKRAIRSYRLAPDCEPAHVLSFGSHAWFRYRSMACHRRYALRALILWAKLNHKPAATELPRSSSLRRDKLGGVRFRPGFLNSKAY